MDEVITVYASERLCKIIEQEYPNRSLFWDGPYSLTVSEYNRCVLIGAEQQKAEAANGKNSHRDHGA